MNRKHFSVCEVLGVALIAMFFCGVSGATTIPIGSAGLALDHGFLNLGSPGDVPLVGDPPGPGDTDTTLDWPSPFDLPTPSTDPVSVPIELHTLSLESANPVNIGGSFFDVFFDLSPDPPSLGTLELHEGGTFTSFFDVFFDIRLDPVGGGAPTLFPDIPATPTGTGTWDRDAFGDFHIDTLDLNFGGAGELSFRRAVIPEPAGVVLLGAGLLGLAWRKRAQ